MAGAQAIIMQHEMADEWFSVEIQFNSQSQPSASPIQVKSLQPVWPVTQTIPLVHDMYVGSTPIFISDHQQASFNLDRTQSQQTTALFSFLSLNQRHSIHVWCACASSAWLPDWEETDFENGQFRNFYIYVCTTNGHHTMKAKIWKNTVLGNGTR